MLQFLKHRLADEEGAMDKILVTLLFVVVAVTGIIGISTWADNTQATLEKQAVMQIDYALEQDAPAAGDITYEVSADSDGIEYVNYVEEELKLED